MDYISKDRQKIGTKEEVLEYEAKVEAEKAKKAKLAEEKQARKDEIKADYEALLDSIAQYNKDYNEPVKFNSNSPLGGVYNNPFSSLFRTPFWW